MNFKELQQAEKPYDELMVIGKNIEKQGQLYHIAGMTRCGTQAVLYVLEQESLIKKDKNKNEAKVKSKIQKNNIKENSIHTEQTNRINMKNRSENSYFFDIEELRIGNDICSVQQASSGRLGIQNYERLFLFFDMFHAGWKPQDEPFWTVDWEELMLTEVVFDLKQEKLPVWQGDIFVKMHKRHKTYLVEKPVCLKTGEESEIEFVLEDDRKGICYINKVYPMDIWKEQEEQFQNPKYLERMTEKELEEMKQKFYSCLEQSCPKGMCYLGIEYECTLKGNLIFYDSEFLEAGPKTGNGSTTSLMIMLKPDEPIGKHGYENHGCVIQTPVFSDIEKLSAEIFQYIEFLPEKEELLIIKAQ
ncbi:MAG: hypothetical protein K2N61_03190 [Lachnospiraceae bacterium]|nr:hypothetical protein [Lachnospiraceae bacterium]